jgi:hypothetical protein
VLVKQLVKRRNAEDANLSVDAPLMAVNPSLFSNTFASRGAVAFA